MNTTRIFLKPSRVKFFILLILLIVIFVSGEYILFPGSDYSFKYLAQKLAIRDFEPSNVTEKLTYFLEMKYDIVKYVSAAIITLIFYIFIIVVSY